MRQAPAPLLINMIALGSLYVPAPDAKEKVSCAVAERVCADLTQGEALWRLVYKGVGASVSATMTRDTRLIYRSGTA